MERKIGRPYSVEIKLEFAQHEEEETNTHSMERETLQCREK